MKSKTCRKDNGEYLSEYHTLFEAEQAAADARKAFGHELAPIKCRACGYWHLGPASSRKVCLYCFGSALFHKDLYPTREVALTEVARISREKKVSLDVYKCPHANGWHLTKRKERK